MYVSNSFRLCRQVTRVSSTNLSSHCFRKTRRMKSLRDRLLLRSVPTHRRASKRTLVANPEHWWACTYATCEEHQKQAFFCFSSLKSLLQKVVWAHQESRMLDIGLLKDQVWYMFGLLQSVKPGWGNFCFFIHVAILCALCLQWSCEIAVFAI